MSDNAGINFSLNIYFSGKNLWTDIKNGEQIGLFQANDATDEAEHVVGMIRDFNRHHSNIPLSQIAILYRTNAQCKSFFFYHQNNLFFLFLNNST